MPKSSKIALLVVSVVLVLSVFLGARATGVSAATEAQDGGAYPQINVYSEVLRHIQADYVVTPNIPEVTDGALRGLLESLDADSSYLSRSDFAAYKAQKAADGSSKAQIGVVLSKRYGYATVVSVVPNSPADRANLNDGDILEAIGGKDTRNISLAMLDTMLSGTPGSQVSVGVVRPAKDEPQTLNLTRAVVAQPPVTDTLYENSSILYLKPVTLDREHVDAVEAKLKGVDKGGQKKVLLDLRDVASGDMSQAVRMANFFLNKGTIATLEGQTVAKVTYTADAAKAIDATTPLVVLVNHGTSGPGELVAGALLDNKRAELVGDKTFGEGGEQKTFDLPDGAAVILTVAKYASPSGKKFQDDAVTPDVLVAGIPPDEGDDADTPDLTKATSGVKAPVVRNQQSR
jgi:carboxyl-terminal processing protease